MEEGKKYCKLCGEIIDSDCIICPKCGKQIENIAYQNPNIVINNNNSNANINQNVNTGQTGKYRCPKNKWVAFFLCLFTVFGHKFYDGKILMGLLYMITFGLFGFGWFIDLIIILFKPNPYYV